MVRQARLPLLSFALVASAVYATALTMARLRPELRHPEVVSVGLLVDLLVVVPLAYYLLVVRRAGWPARTLLPLAVLSLSGATLLVPDQRETLKRLSEALVTPAEIGLLAWIAVRTVRSVRRSGGPDAEDMLERLRTVAREVLPLRRVAEALAFEMAVIYYSLFAWRRHPRFPATTQVFTYHRKSSYGALGFALLLATIGEAIPVHLLVSGWSPKAAWILTALAAYGVLWFLADYRATRLRPILLEGDLLRLRTGLRWTLRIPLSHIAAIHTRPPRSEPVLRASLPFTKPVWIELTEPATAQGPYGKEKKTRWIAVAVDDLARFREALAAGIPTAENRGILG